MRNYQEKEKEVSTENFLRRLFILFVSFDERVGFVATEWIWKESAVKAESWKSVCI